MDRPVIMINTDNYPVFCGNRCRHTGCSRHISKAYDCAGVCEISKLRGTKECEGCIHVKRKQKGETP